MAKPKKDILEDFGLTCHRGVVYFIQQKAKIKGGGVMEGKAPFGDFAKQKRLEAGLTLRGFCRKYGYDVGDMSKYERGVLSPPKSPAVLERYARDLGIAEGSDEWQTFFELAAISAGRIPEYIASDSDLMAKLPLVFRTISGRPLTRQKLRQLAKIIQEA